MDIGLLFFWLDDDGSIHKLSAAKLGKICTRAAPMQEFTGRCVRVIAVIVDVVDRNPQRIRDVGGMKVYFGGDGYIDEAKHIEDLRLAVQALDEDDDDESRPAKVKDITAIRALQQSKSEYSFSVTPKHIAAVADMIWKRRRRR